MSDTSGSSPPLCDFCSSIDWNEVLTGPFNPRKEKLDIGYLKHGEHNLGAILSNRDTCELCRLIGNASQKELKAWAPIADKLDKPELITCAFFSRRNRLGSAVQTRRIAQADSLLDLVLASIKPGYSSTGLIAQEFLDSLPERGISLDSDVKANGNRNNSLNVLLVMAGVSPVTATTQQFLQLHPCLYPVPSVDQYAEGTEPFTAFPTGRIVHPEVNTRLLRRWYEDCIANHGESCSRPSWLGPDADKWPQNLRLIDIERACIVDAPSEAGYTYVALSYVWGEEQDPFRAATANLEALKAPGALASRALPKTLADALYLARALGASHLWADRLCVLQDSPADQAVQIPQMDLVYSRAALTLAAASGRSARDGLAGVNGTPRDTARPRARVAADLVFASVLRLDAAYRDCVWRTRGWTFQEGLCARRVLLISDDQAFWSCARAKRCEALALEAFPTAIGAGDIPAAVLTGHGVFAELGGGGAASFGYAELDGLIAGYCARRLGLQDDALGAFEGVLNRVVGANPGHGFYWGHPVAVRFDESIAWSNFPWGSDVWNSGIMPERRRAVQRVRGGDGELREVPFPSWSWLGWRDVLGVTKAAPRQVILTPELDIAKLDIHGRAALLASQGSAPLESVSRIDMRGVDASTSAGWKGDTAIPPERLHRGGEFEDSGRLLFWTSHAVLYTSEGGIYSETESQERVRLGELKPFWPWQATKPEGKFSFIVVSRKHNDNDSKVLRTERKLNVLGVEWEDREKHVASRLFVGEVDEEAWVGVKREWILVTLT
ncbi:HET-domain-containing protein [Biscogniauxia marginata]|nr:HET-domain-containing protein [Biscogniauxia marginata]